MQLNHSSLHFHILNSLVETGTAPTIAEMQQHFAVDTSAMTEALVSLQDYHGVVLHPKSKEVWVMHPFSTAPTNFFIRSGHCCWWGNCAWCALGAAALLKRDLTITTTSGGEDQQLILNIKAGEIDNQKLFVHFPIPMQQAWDNVTYTCSNMLMFTSEAEVAQWCIRHKMPIGDIQPIAKIWDFAKVWYGQHLQPDWQKWTLDEARQIFENFGLTSPIWQLPVANERF